MNYRGCFEFGNLRNSYSAIWTVWLNGWVFVYRLSGCGFGSRFSYLNFRFRVSLEQGVPWNSGNYRVWIHSEICLIIIKDLNYRKGFEFGNMRSIYSAIWPVWLSGWVFVYELSGCEFGSRFSHLNFRFCACFEQGVPWNSGNYRVWIHSETRTWHDKNIQTLFEICF